ncbi:hypothetical protein GDO81_017293 [Engystomops pustulosus]|uniref:UDP-glucuronosyltransferase n=1 Tax=Engystomops pustulosus TaxID=76066 RepID=A0AAV7AH64_ENGPU|nr:hypothetical protein GDO81_017293 [Engystomops pustulosus]
MDLSKFPVSTIILLLYMIFSQADGGKLLVFPVDGSHWLSMRPVVEKLSQNGHKVVVIMPESTVTMGGSEKYSVQSFPVPFTSQELKTLMETFGRAHFSLPSHFPWVAMEMLNSMLVVYNVFSKICETLLLDQEIMKKFEDEKFDAMLMDPGLPCGMILAEHLTCQITTLQQTSIWLLRYDFVFEYPNICQLIFIGGINCALQKALPQLLPVFIFKQLWYIDINN